MTVNPILKIIRAKKLGVLIRDARVNSGKSIEDCAQAIGVSVDELNAMELGDRPPTLPELEMFAYYLEVPLDHFWGSQILSHNGNGKEYDPQEIKQLRQAAIGALVRKVRLEADLSLDELAEKSGLSFETLSSYEKGESAIPLPELETLARVMNNTITNFEDQDSLVGNWFIEQKNMQEYLKLPKDLQEFIGKPVNRPYINLAIKLSEMKVEKLRALAEGLLEITF